MSDNKELLEATVKGLQDKIGSLNLELKQKQQDLEDANKPEIKASQLDIIENSFDTTFQNFDLDINQFEYEFNLNYENKIELSDLTFTDAYDLVEAIVTKVEKQFKIEQDEEANE